MKKTVLIILLLIILFRGTLYADDVSDELSQNEQYIDIEVVGDSVLILREDGTLYFSGFESEKVNEILSGYSNVKAIDFNYSEIMILTEKSEVDVVFTYGDYLKNIFPNTKIKEMKSSQDEIVAISEENQLQIYTTSSYYDPPRLDSNKFDIDKYNDVKQIAINDYYLLILNNDSILEAISLDDMTSVYSDDVATIFDDSISNSYGFVRMTNGDVRRMWLFDDFVVHFYVYEEYRDVKEIYQSFNGEIVIDNSGSIVISDDCSDYGLLNSYVENFANMNDVLKLEFGNDFVLVLLDDGSLKVAGAKDYILEYQNMKNVEELKLLSYSSGVAYLKDGSIGSVGSISQMEKLKTWNHVKNVEKSWNGVIAVFEDGSIDFDGGVEFSTESELKSIDRSENVADIVRINQHGSYALLLENGKVMNYKFDGFNDSTSWSKVKRLEYTAKELIAYRENGSIYIGRDLYSSNTDKNGLLLNKTGIIQVIGIPYDGLLLLTEDGEVEFLEMDGEVSVSDSIYNVEKWEGIKEIVTCEYQNVMGYVGLKLDGTLVYTREEFEELGTWENVIKLVGGNHLIGMKNDGSLYGFGDNTYGQLDIADWDNIKEIYCDEYHTIGLTNDGFVKVSGNKFNKLKIPGFVFGKEAANDDLNNYSLTIENNLGGLVEYTPLKTFYNKDDLVEIKAVENEGYSFKHWIINGKTYLGIINIIKIQEDTIVVPIFEYNSYDARMTEIGLTHLTNNQYEALYENTMISELSDGVINNNDKIWSTYDSNITWGNLYDDILGGIKVIKKFEFIEDGIKLRIVWFEDKENDEIYQCFSSDYIDDENSRYAYNQFMLSNELFTKSLDNYSELKNQFSENKITHIGSYYGGIFSDFVYDISEEESFTYNAPSNTFEKRTFDSIGADYSIIDSRVFTRFSTFTRKSNVINYTGKSYDEKSIDFVIDGSNIGKVNSMYYDDINIDTTWTIEDLHPNDDSNIDDLGHFFSYSNGRYSFSNIIEKNQINQSQELRFSKKYDSTISANVNLIMGTDDDDTLESIGKPWYTDYSQYNFIYGGEGIDTITAKYDDYTFGNDGNDTLIGEELNNTYLFRVGDDHDTIADLNGIDSIVIFGEKLSIDSINIDTENNKTTLKYSDTDSIRWNSETNIERLIIENETSKKEYSLNSLMVSQKLSEVFEENSFNYYKPDFYTLYENGLLDEYGDVKLTTIVANYALRGSWSDLLWALWGVEFVEIDEIFLDIAQSKNSQLIDYSTSELDNILSESSKIVSLYEDANVLISPFNSSELSNLYNLVDGKEKIDFITDLDTILDDGIFATEAISIVNNMKDDDIEQFVNTIYMAYEYSAKPIDFANIMSDTRLVNYDTIAWEKIDTNIVPKVMNDVLNSLEYSILFNETIKGALIYQMLNEEVIKEYKRILPMLNEPCGAKLIIVIAEAKDASEKQTEYFLRNITNQTMEIVTNKIISSGVDKARIEVIEKYFNSLGLSSIIKQANIIYTIKEIAMFATDSATNGSEIMESQLRIIGSIKTKELLMDSIIELYEKDGEFSTKESQMDALIALKYIYKLEKTANASYVKLLENQAEAFFQGFIGEEKLVEYTNERLAEARKDSSVIENAIEDCERILTENYKFSIDVVNSENVILNPYKSTYYYNEEIYIEAKEREGYQFKGWIGLDNQNKIQSINVTKDLVIESKYSENN